MGPSFSPLAEALNLGPSTLSPWLAQSVVLLGSQAPFRAAVRLLTHFTGITISHTAVQRHTDAVGQTVQQLELAFATEVQATGTVPEPPAEVPLQLSIDGSLVHLRDEGWREVKVLAIGARQAEGAGLSGLSYAATLGSVDAFADASVGELGRRGVFQARDVVAVNDGAVWIGQVLDLHCPQAVRVLDFAHAAGYLSRAATAAFGETPAAHDWWTTQCQVLRDDDPDVVLAALAALPGGEEQATALGYLTARREQIAYRDYRARCWPIGSGCVESAHKTIVQVRLKGRGMRWSRRGAEALLALRVLQENERWAQTWPAVGPHQQQARRDRTARRRDDRRATRRHPRPARPPLIVDGKPTIDHPWKRALKRRGPQPAP